MNTNSTRTLYFGAAGLLGAFLAALVTDWFLWSEKPSQVPASVPVDIVFALDTSGSMKDEVDAVKTKMATFASALTSSGSEASKIVIDWRLGLTVFGTGKAEGRRRLLFGPAKEDLTPSLADFSAALQPIRVANGWPDGEDQLDAAVTAAGTHFRANSQRMLILITDEKPGGTASNKAPMAEAAESLRRAGVQHLFLVTAPVDQAAFDQLRGNPPLPGEHFDVANPNGMESMLPTFGTAVREAAASFVTRSGGGGSAGGRAQWVQSALTAVWTGGVAMMIAIALILVQQVYLRKPWFGPGLLGAVGNGLGVGLAAGLAAQALFLSLHGQFPEWGARLASWGLMGAIVGGVLGWRKVVPNLGLWRGLLGGLIGGGVGGLVFEGILLNPAWGDMFGRLSGAMAVGLGIGLMVALVEIIARKAWVEVYYKADKFTRRIALGNEPVSVGPDPGCTVVVSSAPSVGRFQMRDGRVFRSEGGREEEVKGGTNYSYGRIDVTIQTKSTAPAPAGGGKAWAEVVGHPAQAGVFGLKNCSGKPWAVNVPGEPSPLRIEDGKTVKCLVGVVAARDDGTPLFKIVSNPTDASVMGLSNLSSSTWSFALAGQTGSIAPGKSVRIQDRILLS